MVNQRKNGIRIPPQSIDSEKDAIIKRRYGIGMEDYLWLVGK